MVGIPGLASSATIDESLLQGGHARYRFRELHGADTRYPFVV